MEGELVSLFTAAKKAADAAAASDVSPDGAEVSRCIDALKKLQSFNINNDLLISTMIAKRLRPIRKHPNIAIRSIASEIFQRWTTLFVEELAREEKLRPKKSNVDHQNAMVRVSNQRTITAPTQNVDASSNRIRERLVAALTRVAAEVSDESLRREVEANCDLLRVASSIESAMFENIEKPDSQKKKIIRSILFNLGDPKNPDLRRKVLIGEVSAERLVNMSNAEMASDAMKAKIRQIEERALAKCQTDCGDHSSVDDIATTDQFKCGRCGERKTVYHQMQTRSADEPMTTYVTCVNCDHHWKFC